MNKGPVFEAQPGWGGKIGTWLSSNKFWLIPIVIIVAFIVVIWAKSDSKPENATASTSPTTSNITSLVSSEVVIKSDSYTTVARRFISKALLVEQTGQITKGNQLYAETLLAKVLKTQTLQVGATITTPISSIWDSLNGYANLYPSQRVKWEAMAKNIKF